MIYRDNRQERYVSEDALDKAFMERVDACVEYVTIQVSYVSGESTVAEAYRVVVNALKFILFGDEQAYGFVTTPESFNLLALSDTLVWVRGNITPTGNAHERIQRLTASVSGAMHT